MKRNFEAIQYILEEIEKHQKDYQSVSFKFDDSDRFSFQLLTYNLNLLTDSGFVDGSTFGFGKGEHKVNFITWKGHDLLDVLRVENFQYLKQIKDNIF